MTENICPRCGGKMNIDEKGNASCDYCGYEKVSELTILSARGNEELKHKSETAMRSAHAAEVADYNSKINALCIEYNSAGKPLELYKKQMKIFGLLMLLPVLFFIIYMIIFDEYEFASYVILGLVIVSALADIGFFIVLMANLSNIRNTKNRLKMKENKISEMLAAHPDGDRSSEVDAWIKQFATVKKKKN